MRLLILLCLTFTTAHAREQILTLTSENDAYTATGDGYYTNGLRGSWLDADNRIPSWLQSITDALPISQPISTTVPVYSIGQNLYSPRSLVPFTNQSADRPYAGYLYGAVGLTVVGPQFVDDLELSAGLVGPAALGQIVHSRYHEVIGVQKPNGWEHQLDNEPTLGLAWQRRWPRRLAIPVGKGLISTMPFVGGAVGNVTTHASAGAILSWRSNAAQLMDNPIRVKPSIPGTGYFSTTNQLGWMVYAGAEARAVAHNIFIDGNLFNSTELDKRTMVTDLTAGVTFTYKRYQWGYGIVTRSREFRGQPTAQTFGALHLGYKF